MYQLNLLWAFVPDALIAWIVNGLVIVGLVGIAAGFVTKWIPGIGPYAGLARTIGIVCLVLGVYFKGGSDVERVWRERVAQLESKVAQAEKKSAAANDKLAAEIKQNQKLNKEVRDAVNASIKANADKIDSVCRVDDVAISLHNSASQNKISGSTTGTAKTLPNPATNRPTGSSSK